MSKLEFFAKSQEYDQTGRASGTKVMLGTADGGLLPVFLPPDVIDLSNSELYELAMEQHYQINFPQRAENEKFLEHENALQEHRDEISRIKEEALAQIRAENEKISQMVKTVTLVLNRVLMRIPIDGEEEVDDAESETIETTTEE